ncbi:hypothetical protein SeMB42_g03579 [Synchytrium endobioticum]|uniref:Uncharacterized protein n=1 Tax=Synchytrium endobioticum TaxID=286115 RepID=A0A507D7A4_9FUNG|nr:hypothetical protein SeMB42_g03579 [Synchytrium endobioticum]
MYAHAYFTSAATSSIFRSPDVIMGWRSGTNPKGSDLDLDRRARITALCADHLQPLLKCRRLRGRGVTAFRKG